MPDGMAEPRQGEIVRVAFIEIDMADGLTALIDDGDLVFLLEKLNRIDHAEGNGKAGGRAQRPSRVNRFAPAILIALGAHRLCCVRQ